MGSSVVSLSEPLGILVIPAASQIGHCPGNGASLHDRPGPVIYCTFDLEYLVGH
jgi:hypothetical protein